MLVVSCLGVLHLVAYCGLALREAVRVAGLDRLLMASLAALFALFACGAVAGL